MARKWGQTYRSDAEAAEATGNLLADFKRLSTRAQSLKTLSVCNVTDKHSASMLWNSRGGVGKERRLQEN